MARRHVRKRQAYTPENVYLALPSMAAIDPVPPKLHEVKKAIAW
jgi:hypothetical protein